MYTTQYGEQVLSESDLCNALYENPHLKLTHILTNDPITKPDIELENFPIINHPSIENLSIEDFDINNQSRWYMPDDYKNLDIVKWVIDQCRTDAELQRVAHELLLFQKLDMFPLLQYCKYFVDTMRKHGIVLGVGRGSSVASYVLYLIGVHKINSMYYDLQIEEFLHN